MKVARLYINKKECGHAGLADSFTLRLRGMIGRDFSSFDALLIQPCAEIHMMFMKYPIDAVFINSEGKIVRICTHLKPWTLYIGAKRAKSVLELPAGKAEEWELFVGDSVSVQ